ncbi:MAG: transposase [Ilumatobacteraceae bacterium]
MLPVSRTIDRYDTTFDNDGLIANAGLIMIATLMSRLGLERLVNTWVRTGSFAPVIDLDSTICEVHGHAKQGAGYGYTKCLGYHPLVATRVGTGEILFSRMRKGSAGSSRGINRFVDELSGVLKRAKATGAKCVRADSGFWSWELLRNSRPPPHDLVDHGHQQRQVQSCDRRDPETAWADIDDTLGGYAQVAETTYEGGGPRNKDRHVVRLVVRRTRLADNAQQALFPGWRHHSFITNRADLDTVEADPFNETSSGGKVRR